MSHIGGRRGAMCRMCDIVKKMNGNLVYHDGGKEDSLASLSSAVSSADAVLFPTNCKQSSALEAKVRKEWLNLICLSVQQVLIANKWPCRN